MNALADAKAEVADARRRISRAIVAALSTRVAVAVGAVLTLTFATQLIYAPGRTPPLGGFSLVQLGLPPLDLGRAGQALQEAGAAAKRQDAAGAIGGFLAEHPVLIPYLNGVGLVLSLALFAWTLRLQMRAVASHNVPAYYDGLAHTRR
jgi:hypothetical protein